MNRKKNKTACSLRTLYESDIQAAVIEAINQVIVQKDDLLPGLRTAIKKALGSGNDAKLSEIDDKLEQIDTIRDLKRELLLEDANNVDIQRHLNVIESFLETQPTAVEEYDEDLVRKLLERVTVYDDHLTFVFKSGITVDISM